MAEGEYLISRAEMDTWAALGIDGVNEYFDETLRRFKEWRAAQPEPEQT